MKVFSRVLVALALVGLCGTAVSAQDGQYRGIQELAPAHKPVPGASLVAAASNLFFMPIRLAVTTVGAGLGGLTGFLLAGNRQAADDVWGLFDGQNIITPRVAQGEERLRFGRYEARVLLITPGY